MEEAAEKAHGRQEPGMNVVLDFETPCGDRKHASKMVNLSTGIHASHSVMTLVRIQEVSI